MLFTCFCERVFRVTGQMLEGSCYFLGSWMSCMCKAPFTRTIFAGPVHAPRLSTTLILLRVFIRGRNGSLVISAAASWRTVGKTTTSCVAMGAFIHPVCPALGEGQVSVNAGRKGTRPLSASLEYLVCTIFSILWTFTWRWQLLFKKCIQNF